MYPNRFIRISERGYVDKKKIVACYFDVKNRCWLVDLCFDCSEHKRFEIADEYVDDVVDYIRTAI